MLLHVGLHPCLHVSAGQDGKDKKAASQLLPPESAQHWFGRRLRFRPASSEQQMIWRRELPEYHRGLVGGCRILLKPLPPGKALVKAGRGKGA